MKQIACEVCGSPDFVKQDGMFVCQSCGMKYTVEEVRKLMGMEAGAGVPGSAGSSAKLENLYNRARKSLEVDDLEHAAEYFKEILDEKPDDWEAYFYAYLGETTSFTNAQAGSVAAKLGSTIPAAYDMAIGSGSPEEKNDRVKTITTKTAARLIGIASTGEALLRQYEGGNLLSTHGRVVSNLYDGIRPVAQNTIIDCVLAFDPLISKVEEISQKDPDLNPIVCNDCLLSLQQSRYNIGNMTFSPASGLSEKLVKDELLKEYTQKLEQLEKDIAVLREKRFDEYWAAHQQEKAALEARHAAVEAKIAELENAVEQLPESVQRRGLTEKIADAEQKMSSLGIFKSKEKKALQASIDEMKASLEKYNTICEEKHKIIEPTVDKLQEELKKIEHELSKDR